MIDKKTTQNLMHSARLTSAQAAGTLSDVIFSYPQDRSN